MYELLFLYLVQYLLRPKAKLELVQPTVMSDLL
jgi:hypothetical protein